MKLERRSDGQSSRGAGLLVCAGGVLSCVLGCSTYPTLKNVPIDCTADSAYDFLQIDNFETAGEMPFYTAADNTSSTPLTDTVETIPDGPRCSSKMALLLQSSHHNDWGSLFGFNNFGPRDGSAYEGVSFWARATGDSNTSFTLILDDPNSNNLMTAPTCGAGVITPPTPTDAGPTDQCKNYCMPEAGAPVTTYTDPGTGMTVGGGTSAAPPADACGNDYQAVVVVNAQWQFYTVPFTKFLQGYMPNRVPNPLLTVTGDIPGTGLRTNTLTTFVIRLPKEANADLWFDNLAFYRPKKAGGDGGADAPRM